MAEWPTCCVWARGSSDRATIEIIKSDPVAASGAVYVERTRIAGPITTRSRWTITEFDQKHMVQRHVGDDLLGLRDLWVQLQVQPHGRGAHFTLALGFTVSMGPLSRPVSAWLKRTFGAGNVRNVQHFARIAEALAAESTV
ncbi:MAG: hypothetical protein M3291_01675 [Actinomycetota bacterium]|nr:hypothetical protein [Actinomycetota bacterium]